jgi:DNA invertase Pin-like site-specific DNA recombinase
MAGEYVDNDVSAWNGKARPQFRRLLEDIRQGNVDGVVVWDLDRLNRTPRELEQFLDVCDAAKVRQLGTVSGDVDLATHDGRFHARILCAVARKESDDKSRRMKRKLDELAKTGRWHGRGRAYGYDEQRQVIADEAAVIRETTRRLLSGETLRAVTADLNVRLVPTITGTRWSSTTLREMVISPRLAGLRDHRGEVVGRGAWDAVLSVEDHTRVRALLTDPARRTNRNPRKYLLTGLLSCGRCGARIVSRPKRGKRCYQCVRDLGGCGGLAVMSEPLEGMVTEALFYRLDTPQLARALAKRDDKDGAGVTTHLAEDEAQLQELAHLWGNKQITLREYLAARNPIEARLAQGRAHLANHDQHATLREVAGRAGALRRQWPNLNLDRRHAIVRGLLERLTIQPATQRGFQRNPPGRGKPAVNASFDPARVEPVWRL